MNQDSLEHHLLQGTCEFHLKKEILSVVCQHTFRNSDMSRHPFHHKKHFEENLEKNMGKEEEKKNSIQLED